MRGSFLAKTKGQAKILTIFRLSFFVLTDIFAFVEHFFF